MVPAQQNGSILTKHGLDLVLGQRGNGGEVDGEHQSLEGPRNLGRVGAGADNVGLQGRGVGDFEERVDIADVDLP